VVDPEPGLRLPLVHHLVQQGVLDFGPGVPRQVAATHRDLRGAAGAEIGGELSQPGAHPARQPDRNVTQRATEMLRVEAPARGLKLV
jgi:hypothetical protein